MPQDTRPKKSLALPQRSRARRELPQEFHQRLQIEHDAGQPHVYTSAEIRAISRFVSTPAASGSGSIHTAETRRRHEQQLRAIRETHRQNQLAIREEAEWRQAERDCALFDRLSEPRKPTLQERIAKGAAERAPTILIAPKPILIDFKKHTTEDLIGIFRPRLNATLTRLSAIPEVDGFQDLVYDHFRAYQRTVDKLTLLRDQLELRAPTVTPAEWRTLEWGLKKIGGISFKGLRKNLDNVIVELYRVERDSHFDWIG